MRDIYIGDARIWQSLKLRRYSSDATQAIKQFSKDYELLRTIPVIGLEKLIIQKNLNTIGEKEITADEIFDDLYFKDSGFYGYLMDRPESELAFLNLIEYGIPTKREWLNTICKVSESLSGNCVLRSRRGYTTRFASGQRIEFLVPESIVPRLYDTLCNTVLCNEFDPFEKAVACYLDILTIHPLPDGNGRLARCMFMYSLYCDGILTSPILPIGPAIALRRSAILSGCLQWQLNLNAVPMLETMTNIVNSTIENVSEILDTHSRT